MTGCKKTDTYLSNGSLWVELDVPRSYVAVYPQSMKKCTPLDDIFLNIYRITCSDYSTVAREEDGALW